MKGVVILAVVIALVGASFWGVVMHESMKDSGVWILVATGKQKGMPAAMDVSVELQMAMRTKVNSDKNGNPLWEDWVAQHFELRDAEGKVLPGTRIAHSQLVNEEKTINLPEFYVHYTVEGGKDYTLDYKPRLDKPVHYRHEFRALSDNPTVERLQFDAVKG